MLLESERVQKLMSNSWKSSGVAGLPLMAEREDRTLVGGACSPGFEWDRGAGFHLAKRTPRLESLDGVPANSTAQHGEITMERVYLGFTIRIGVKRHLQIANYGILVPECNEVGDPYRGLWKPPHRGKRKLFTKARKVKQPSQDFTAKGHSWGLSLSPQDQVGEWRAGVSGRDLTLEWKQVSERAKFPGKVGGAHNSDRHNIPASNLQRQKTHH